MRERKKSGAEFSTLRILLRRVIDLFHLSSETDKQGTIASIQESVEFRGNNVWSLILAIFIASIGLNLNSPAVIIGAMLISPLMGPITGAGLALAIVDLELLKKSLMNLLLMTFLSLVTSSLYFSVSPLSGAGTELLARASPTFYDVLIAILGGTALIISLSRKTRSTNALAGVAIATALMPPLCAAGYGLAARDLSLFFGAFYLYLINSVFIGLITFVFAKYLKLGQARQQAGNNLNRRNALLVVTVIVVFITPSVVMTIGSIQETSSRVRIEHFVEENMKFDNSQVLGTRRLEQGGRATLEVTMVGASISEEMISHLQSLLRSSGFPNMDLKIIQSGSSDAANPAVKKPTEVSTGPDEPSLRLESENQALKEEISRLKDPAALIADVTRELNLLFPDLVSASFGDLLAVDSQVFTTSHEYTVLAKWQKSATDVDKTRLSIYIKMRLKMANVSVVNYE